MESTENTDLFRPVHQRRGSENRLFRWQCHLFIRKSEDFFILHLDFFAVLL